MIRFVPAAMVALLAPMATLAQIAPASSLAGRVLSEGGRSLRAAVSLSFAEPRGYPAPPRRVLTGQDGTFTFSKLDAGRYVLCAQVLASDAAPAGSPYLDTCAWPAGQPIVTLAAGQQMAGLVFTAPKGAMLNVHVADPDRVLPAAAERRPAALEPELQVILQGPDGLVRHARLASGDNASRTYQIIVPRGTPVNVKVASSVAGVFDPRGIQLHDKDETAVRPVTAADLTSMEFTLRRK